MNVLSLFAGIGGLDLGLEAHGCETVAYSEVDPFAASIMSRQFPEAPNLGDITTVQFLRYADGICTASSPATTDLAAADRDGEVHLGHSDNLIICGGFPCQDISLAGKGAGIKEGTRSGLWSYYADAIRVLRPRGILVENVAQLAKNGLDIVLGDLADCGYDAEWQVLRADDHGYPHARRRLFILAYPNGEREQVSPGRKQPAVQVAGGASPARRAGAGPRFHWTAQPGVGRGHDGLPDWVDGEVVIPPHSEEPRNSKRWDRLRCLGNAVVPACAERASTRLMERIGGE